MAEDTPVKRGRGRPPGALNKKTVEKQREMEEATTLDVSFEEPEEVLEPVIEEEPEDPKAAELPKAKAKAKRKPRKPPYKRESPPPLPTDVEDEETVVAEYESASSGVESEPEVAPPPSPKKRARPKPRPKALPRDPEPPPLTYLQVLQRGLLAAKATHKAEKVAKYDTYFANL